MALFRAETKPISRGKGHNAVKAAAYRAGEKLEDKNRYNANRGTHDYSKKKGVISADIILPNSLERIGFSISRQELWSQVEETEVTKRGNKMKANARLAREWLLALPHELSEQDNRELALEFASRLANDLGVIADCAIHKPTDKEISKAKENQDKSDPRNVHAHIMFTTRKAELNGKGNLVFTDKADSEISGTAREKKKLKKEKEYLKDVRQMWADMVNQKLFMNGHHTTVDARSYIDQELDVLPKVHEGRKSKKAEMDTLNSFEDRRAYNNEVTKRNELTFKSRTDTLVSIANKANGASDSSEQSFRKRQQSEKDNDKRLNNSQRAINEASRAINRRAEQPPNPFADRLTASFNRRKQASNKLTDSVHETRRRIEERKRIIIAGNEKKRIDDAVKVYQAVFPQDTGFTASDWSGKAESTKGRYNTDRAIFNERQLNILENIEDISAWSSEKQIRSKLQEVDKVDIVELLLNPNTEEVRHSLLEETRRLSDAQQAQENLTVDTTVVNSTKQPTEDNNELNTAVNMHRFKF